jgi:hypothetical protein
VLCRNESLPNVWMETEMGLNDAAHKKKRELKTKQTGRGIEKEKQRLLDWICFL